MSRAPTVYPLFYYFPPLILESAHNCGVFIVGLKLLPKDETGFYITQHTETDKVIIYRGHLEGGNFQCALGLTELGCGQGLKGQRIDGASLQNRFRPNEFKAVLYGEMKINALFGEQQLAFFENPKAHIYISSLHLDRCIIRWFGNQKTFLPYKAGKLYAKLFNVGEKQKKQLLYSKFIILLDDWSHGACQLMRAHLLHFLSIYFKEASNTDIFCYLHLPYRDWLQARQNKRNEKIPVFSRKVYYLIRIWNGKGWKKGLRESLSEVQKGAGILRISEAVDFFLLRVLLLFVHHLTFRVHLGLLTRIERGEEEKEGIYLDFFIVCFFIDGGLSFLRELLGIIAFMMTYGHNQTNLLKNLVPILVKAQGGCINFQLDFFFFLEIPLSYIYRIYKLEFFYFQALVGSAVSRAGNLLGQPSKQMCYFMAFQNEWRGDTQPFWYTLSNPNQ
ncbi:hypothetical protein ACJX0J_001377 (mitochondrion) [Zea mays]